MDVNNGSESVVVGSEEQNLVELEEAMNNIQNQVGKEINEFSDEVVEGNSNEETEDSGIVKQTAETACQERVPDNQEQIKDITDIANIDSTIAANTDDLMDLDETPGESGVVSDTSEPTRTVETEQSSCDMEPGSSEVTEYEDKLLDETPGTRENMSSNTEGSQHTTEDTNTPFDSAPSGQLTAEIEDISDAEETDGTSSQVPDSTPMETDPVSAVDVPDEEHKSQSETAMLDRTDVAVKEPSMEQFMPETEAISPAEIFTGTEHSNADLEAHPDETGEETSVQQTEESTNKDSESIDKDVDDIDNNEQADSDRDETTSCEDTRGHIEETIQQLQVPKSDEIRTLEAESVGAQVEEAPNDAQITPQEPTEVQPSDDDNDDAQDRDDGDTGETVEAAEHCADEEFTEAAVSEEPTDTSAASEQPPERSDPSEEPLILDDTSEAPLEASGASEAAPVVSEQPVHTPMASDEQAQADEPMETDAPHLDADVMSNSTSDTPADGKDAEDEDITVARVTDDALVRESTGLQTMDLVRNLRAVVTKVTEDGEPTVMGGTEDGETTIRKVSEAGETVVMEATEDGEPAVTKVTEDRETVAMEATEDGEAAVTKIIEAGETVVMDATEDGEAAVTKVVEDGETTDMEAPVVKVTGDAEEAVTKATEDGEAVSTNVTPVGETVVTESTEDGDTVITTVTEDGEAAVTDTTEDGETVVAKVTEDGDTVVIKATDHDKTKVVNDEIIIDENTDDLKKVKEELEGMEHKVIERQESKSPDVEKSTSTDGTKTEGTKEEKKASKHQQICIVCRRVGKCKYNIVRNGDIKHLCDDLCFKRFRANPTNFLTKKSGETDSKEADRKKSGNCGQCKAALVPGKSVQMDGKHFCSANCAKTNKEGTEDDIEIVGTSKVTPAPKFRQTVPSSKTASKCSVCSQNKPVKHEVNFAKKVHKLCSDSCFAAFRYANKLSMSNCDSCGKSVNSENPANTVQFEGALRKFCTPVCMNTYKTKKQKMVACTWCQAKKTNFDMVERVDGNKVQLFCSLNCLSLYRVNQQATSNQKVTCDHCTNFAPAQYHLTMSDASVRNFCSYNCVMGFQAQFQQPQTPGAGRGGQTPAGVAGRGTPHADRVTPGVGRGSQIPQPSTTATPNQPAGRGRGRPTRQSQRAKGTTTPTAIPATVGTNSMPMISQVMSLAAVGGAVQNQKGKGTIPTSVATVNSANQQPAPPQQTTVSTQIIVQPPQPKPMRNKMVLCKPVTQTKATSCRPHAITEGTQTEEDFVAKPALIPVPIPIYVPVPMAMYNIPVPYPVPIPMPIPVPCFIPTTRKSADGILKQIKKIRDTVPDDPFEAELLMMADAVAGNTVESSSSEDEAVDDAPDDTDDQPQPPPPTTATNESYGEDMLQMALRMASAIPDEPALDLESQLQATPVNPSPALPQPYSTLDSAPMPMSIEPSPHRQKSRAKRRSSSRTPKAKKPKIEDAPSGDAVPEPINIQPQEPPADANMVLKFTYGVNAWKHWVIGKNQVIEKQHAASRSRSRPKLYKTDVLACTPDELNFALCQFVKEVRKPNGEEYAPDSIYYLTLGIQEYIFENGRIDNIFTDIYYEQFTECLNEVLSHYEVRLNQQGLIVCRIEEEHLWESKQLGAHSPHVLLNTLVYFNTKHFMLRSVEEHLRLSFSHIMKHWKKTSLPGGKNPGRSVYLRYYAPVHNQDGARGKRKEDQPVFEQAENVDNPLRCPVKLYEFYLSKCPESIKNRNDVFYLVPERSCVPDSPVWYSTNNLGADHMSKMLNRLRVVKEIQEAQLHMQPYMGPGPTGY